ncbi:MAG: glucose-6-phosphate isomerase [Phycisphaerales bacterium]|nr:glucose-6-phosphate isomerase [Phycisphaerales bacterium]
MQLIRLDLAGCHEGRIGSGGLSLEDQRKAQEPLAAAIERANATAGTGMAGWRTLVQEPTRSQHLDAVRAACATAAGADTLVLLGIGGSALGPAAVHAALRSLTWNLQTNEDRGGPRLFVLDNIDPDLVGPVLDLIRRTDPSFERTVFNVISKSGETAETASQFMIVRSMLEQAGGKHHIVATTDPDQGTLRSLAKQHGWPTLPIPDGVGGRFSELSPVGLFPAAMCGIDIEELLDGAAAMDAVCRSTDMSTNPAAQLAWTLVEMTRRGRSNHVLMPYSNRMALMADWFRQLWAESLGKRHDLNGTEVFAGPTPIKALGATDQHSQIQLYREGPDDKVIGFVTLDEHDAQLAIPRDLGEESLSYLQGHDLSDLLRAEQRATEFALAESGRAHFTIALPRLDASSIGQFLWLWQVATAIAADLLEINAYDQPAVETGKQATFGLMGRQGFEHWVQRVNDQLG